MSMLHIKTECNCDCTTLLRRAIKQDIPIYAEIIECEATILSKINWDNWDGDSLAHIPAGQHHNGKCVQDFARLSKAELQSLLREDTLNIEILGKQGDKFIYHLDAPQTVSQADLHMRQSDYDNYIKKPPSANAANDIPTVTNPTHQVAAGLTNALGQTTPLPNNAATPHIKQAHILTLSELINQYIADKGVGKIRGWKFPDTQRTKFRRLMEILGDIPFNQITRDPARNVRNLISKLPKNPAQFRKGSPTVQQILEKEYTEKLSANTTVRLKV